MIIEDSGDMPAFPVKDASKWQAHGITLRDYFAAKALPAAYAHAVQEAVWQQDSDWRNSMAMDAYAAADAMLAARSRS